MLLLDIADNDLEANKNLLREAYGIKWDKEKLAWQKGSARHSSR
jgi:hypothetical protein